MPKKQDDLPGALPLEALDQRVAIVGTSGSGKTYGAKGLVERLLADHARVCVVDPLGVWWGLRSSADGNGAGFPVVVFGGRHADVPLTEAMGAALGRLIATQALACVVDLSELGCGAARRRFMATFAEALYEANSEPLHLVLDEADLWAPQRPLPDANLLLGRIEEIVRRGRVRGFIPWLITQRPAVVHKDVLSQADILIAMKLTASQDRDAIGAWIEGQADRAEGKRILGEMPRMPRGDGYVWAPGFDLLIRATFPTIRTFDSSRTPQRGEKRITPKTLADVDLSAITAALAVEETAEPTKPGRGDADLRRQLAEAQAEIRRLRGDLEQSHGQLQEAQQRLTQIVSLAGGEKPRASFTHARSATVEMTSPTRHTINDTEPTPSRSPTPARPPTASDGDIHPAARKLLAALAQHAPGRYTWGQAATLAGLKPSGGHYNAGRKALRDAGMVDEQGDLVQASAAGLTAAGDMAMRSHRRNTGGLWTNPATSTST